MVKLRTESSKWWLIILFLAFCMKCCEAEFESQRFNDFVRFERMKNDLFTRSNKKQANSMDDWKCLQELNNIGNGLKKFEPWAEKSQLNQSLIDRFVLSDYFGWYMKILICVYFW